MDTMTAPSRGQPTARPPGLPLVTGVTAESVGQRLEDRQFASLQQACLSRGGLATGDEIARRLRRHVEQPLSMLARWVVRREVLALVWRGQTWLPLFQFELATMTPRASVQAALRELADAFDDWDSTLWWATGNAWLDGAAPLDALDDDPQAVLQAARADRYVALG